MRSKKGFTLIELLAVIVILAIIALIATPIILNIINGSKESSDERSIELYKEAVEQAFARKHLKDSNMQEGYYRKDGATKLVNGNTVIKVDYSGTEVSCAIVKYQSGNLTIDKCNIGTEPEENVDELILKEKYNVNIGDYVNYNHGTNGEYVSLSSANGVSDQTFTTSSYNGLWKVVGIENDKIKLVSDGIIEPISGGTESQGNYQFYQLNGELGYINGVNELNNIGAIFGNGQYAESARSINIDDLKNISQGFNPYVYEATSKEYQHKTKLIGSYGYTVEYSLNSDGTKLNYISENGSTMETDSSFFYHYDSENKQFIRNAEVGKTYKLYNSLTDYSPATIIGKQENYREIPWMKMLYEGTLISQRPYFVASLRDYANTNGFNSYGIYKVAGAQLAGETLCKPTVDSNGNVSIKENTKTFGVKVVVVLESNIELSKVSTKNVDGTIYNVYDIKRSYNYTKKNTEKTDSYGNKYIVPKGFRVVTELASNVTEGIVIEDKNGNQFVWVPTGTIKTSTGTKTINIGRYQFNNLGEASTFTGNSENTSEITPFLESVSKYNGYYIARHEARSNSDSKLSTNPYDNIYNKILRKDALTLCKNMYEENEYFSTSLTNSYAWDTAIVFIQTFENNRTTPYSLESAKYGQLALKGTFGLDEEYHDKACNIYDMAGNCWEWTTESNNGTSVFRGSSYDAAGLANTKAVTSRRGSIDVAYDMTSFRPVLYLK